MRAGCYEPKEDDAKERNEDDDNDPSEFGDGIEIAALQEHGQGHEPDEPVKSIKPGSQSPDEPWGSWAMSRGISSEC